jgi:hypothetical protein
MQTKDFPSVIAVKKYTQPLIEQYKNMMDAEQKTNMHYTISKEKIEQLKKVVANAFKSHFKSDLPDIIAADKLLQGLLDQPECLSKSALVEIICQHTSLTYHCTRTWSAWGVGTMTQDDFEKVNESDLPDELADAILAKIATHPAPFTPITADDVPKQLVHDLWIVGEITSLTNGAETIVTFVNAYMGAKK